MTYEEALEEAEYHIKEIGGVGAHTTPEGAERAYGEAMAALEKLDAALYVIHKELRLKGYERYLITK